MKDLLIILGFDEICKSSIDRGCLSEFGVPGRNHYNREGMPP